MIESAVIIEIRINAIVIISGLTDKVVHSINFIRSVRNKNSVKKNQGPLKAVFGIESICDNDFIAE